MIHVLIVEDSQEKYRVIENHLRNFPELKVTWARTIISTYHILDAELWKIVILDMTFEDAPGIFRATQKKPVAGIQILQYLEASDIETSVIVVTQHDRFPIERRQEPLNTAELDDLLQEAFPNSYSGLIRADLGVASEGWLEELGLKIREILDE